MNGGHRHKLREVTFSVAITLLLCWSGAVRVEDRPAEQLDGVCKADPMPSGYVAVGEMESPECKKSAPGQKNAWLINRLQDKIVACAPPDYASGYPPAIAYLVCERVQSNACPPRLDGTANGFLLTIGSTCTSARIK